MSERVGKETRNAGGTGAGGGADVDAAPVPGKATRAQDHAAAGVSGPGAALPHLDQVQRAFGAHDLSGVRAHTDERAQRANAQMGSLAYTHGEHIAFAGSPDLHTVAHEATHVVQQRAGVAIAGGVGKMGDSHEAQANAVANAVVAGQSAEAFIAAFSSGRGGGGGPAPVQHQSREGRDAAGAPTGAEAAASSAAAGPAAGQSGLARVQAAIGANDVAAIRALEIELRGQMRADALHPPQDARDGLATARRWLMGRVAEIRTQYAPQVQAAAQPAPASGPADPHAAAPRGGQTAATESIEAQMDEACTPYLDALMDGDPQYRYQLDDHAIQDAVFAAVRLHSVRRGANLVGSSDAETEARSVGRLPSGAWCGAFAFTQANAAGGMDPHWAGNMQGEGGIRSALHYGGMENVWLWAFDRWVKLHDYHSERGSLRYYELVQTAAPSHGIQPGDIVLIDNSFGTNPDHVTTALSFDGDWLTTVGGNQGSGAAAVGRNTFQLSQNPTPNDVTDHTYVPQHEGDRRAIAGMHKNVRVHGVGRWSLVDFEQHVYLRSTQRPAAPPSAADVAAKT